MPLWPAGNVNTGQQKYRSENCAMCAVARFMGFNTTGVSIILRAELRAKIKPKNPNYQGADYFNAYAQITNVVVPHPGDLDRHKALQLQLYGIREFIRRRGHTANFIGDVDNQLTHDQLIEQMRADPNGTKYIVFLNHENGYDAHFNYAEKQGGKPVFFDYQTDYGGGTGVVQDELPIWPENPAVGGKATRYCVAIKNC